MPWPFVRMVCSVNSFKKYLRVYSVAGTILNTGEENGEKTRCVSSEITCIQPAHHYTGVKAVMGPQRDTRPR